MELSTRVLAFGCLLCLSLISLTLACGTRNLGWGQPDKIIVIPRPTLIPKLAAAFQDGKASVRQHGHGWGGKYLNLLGGGGGGYEFNNGYGAHIPFARDVKYATHDKGTDSGDKGHYSSDQGNSYKNVNYDTFGDFNNEGQDYSRK